MSLPTTQAAAVALLATIVGIAVGLIPSLATYQSAIISIGGAVLGVVYVVANEFRAHSEAKVKVAQIAAAKTAA